MFQTTNQLSIFLRACICGWYSFSRKTKIPMVYVGITACRCAKLLERSCEGALLGCQALKQSPSRQPTMSSAASKAVQLSSPACLPPAPLSGTSTRAVATASLFSGWRGSWQDVTDIYSDSSMRIGHSMCMDIRSDRCAASCLPYRLVCLNVLHMWVCLIWSCFGRTFSMTHVIIWRFPQMVVPKWMVVYNGKSYEHRWCGGKSILDLRVDRFFLWHSAVTRLQWSSKKVTHLPSLWIPPQKHACA